MRVHVNYDMFNFCCPRVIGLYKDICKYDATVCVVYYCSFDFYKCSRKNS